MSREPASALKMTYAAWTKGSDALILAIRALAAREGVDEALMGEWARSQPSLGPKSERAASVAAPKGWRYVGEMEENRRQLRRRGTPHGLSRGRGPTFTAGWRRSRTGRIPVPRSNEVLDAL